MEKDNILITEYSLAHQNKAYLVIDDNVRLCNLISSFLEKRGATVDVAENGLLGLERYLAKPDQYALILLDIQMPVMDGVETSNRIRASETADAKTIPILAMSGNRVMDSSLFSAYIAKPFDLIELSKTILALVGNAPKSLFRIFS